MGRFTPSRDFAEAERGLAKLVRPRLDPRLFAGRIHRLQRMFSACNASCPPPWFTHDLQITPEINYQSELWLPLAELRPHFDYLYRQALTYRPLYQSTPFAYETSWAAIAANLPAFTGRYTNPAILLELLVGDEALRSKFLFWSFMPGRFYGTGSDRYPVQATTIITWLRSRSAQGNPLRCLDAACGDGANTYGLARLLMEQGYVEDSLEIEGWTIEPLEAWAAAYGRFPHDAAREMDFREGTSNCFEPQLEAAMSFCCADIMKIPPAAEPFDLILCNGLLGGPIIHDPDAIDTVVGNLAGMLTPKGMLLAADHFHGGWKQRCPQHALRALCERHGLTTMETAQGVAALKPDQ